MIAIWKVTPRYKAFVKKMSFQNNFLCRHTLDRGAVSREMMLR